MGKQKYYAVSRGRQTGVFSTWTECEKQVKGFAGAKFKSFSNIKEAEEFAKNGEIYSNCSNADISTPNYHVFVDGSYFDGRYSWAMAIYYNGKLIASYNGVGKDNSISSLHNVAGEIEAAKQAALWAEAHGEKIKLYYDYNGISMWAKGLWKTNNECTRSYANFMKKYLDIIEFIKVEGHTGIEGNELADRLAKKALEENL